MFKQSTKKQKAAVRFSENWTNTAFKGNINNGYECSKFLTEWLSKAKSEYNAYISEAELYDY
jgi:hypothetical protein